MMAVKEVCLAARDFGPGRAQAGDIIDIRTPKGSIGVKEGKDFIWLLIEERELPSRAELRAEAGTEKFKFRFCLPPAQLKILLPRLDLGRLADPDDWYQPCLDCDPQTGLARRRHLTTNVKAMITDRMA